MQMSLTSREMLIKNLFENIKKKKTGDFTSTGEESGAVTGINRLQVALSRQDLAARWQCRVNSPALSSPLIADLQVDVHGEVIYPLLLTLKFSKGATAIFRIGAILTGGAFYGNRIHFMEFVAIFFGEFCCVCFQNEDVSLEHLNSATAERDHHGPGRSGDGRHGRRLVLHRPRRSSGRHHFLVQRLQSAPKKRRRNHSTSGDDSTEINLSPICISGLISINAIVCRFEAGMAEYFRP